MINSKSTEKLLMFINHQPFFSTCGMVDQIWRQFQRFLFFFFLWSANNTVISSMPLKITLFDWLLNFLTCTHLSTTTAPKYLRFKVIQSKISVFLVPHNASLERYYVVGHCYIGEVLEFFVELTYVYYLYIKIGHFLEARMDGSCWFDIIYYLYIYGEKVD